MTNALENHEIVTDFIKNACVTGSDSGVPGPPGRSKGMGTSVLEIKMAAML